MTLHDRILTRTPGRSGCPIHQGKSQTSVLVTIADDRVLVKCFAGCPTKDILSVLGLQWSDLFLGPQPRPGTIAERTRRASFNVYLWRQDETIRCAKQLQLRDDLRVTVNVVRAGAMSESRAWDYLDTAYRGYSELEYWFEILLYDPETLALWRLWRDAGKVGA